MKTLQSRMATSTVLRFPFRNVSLPLLLFIAIAFITTGCGYSITRHYAGDVLPGHDVAWLVPSPATGVTVKSIDGTAVAGLTVGAIELLPGEHTVVADYVMSRTVESKTFSLYGETQSITFNARKGYTYALNGRGKVDGALLTDQLKKMSGPGYVSGFSWEPVIEEVGLNSQSAIFLGINSTRHAYLDLEKKRAELDERKKMYAAVESGVDSLEERLKLYARPADRALDDYTTEVWSLLLYATTRGEVETAKQLIAHGVDVNARTSRSGWTALMEAARLGDYSMVEMLLTQGAQPNVQSKSGETPLSFARKSGNHEVVRLLVQSGALE